MENKKRLSLFLFLCIWGINLFAQNKNTITISGQVSDFDGNPIDSSVVRLMHKDFSTAYETYSNEMGYYTLENVEKGQYMAIFAMRLKEYPRANAVSEEDMRLEFWAWNIIADKDLTINPRYHRLELYGFQVFEVFGGAPYLMAYVRPMSLSKYIVSQRKPHNQLSIRKKKSKKEMNYFEKDLFLIRKSCTFVC